MKDFYQILGVSKTASEQDIKKAYRKLAMEHHPDRNPDNQKEAEERFKDISEAYSVLSDSEKRQRYDMGGFGTSYTNNANDSDPFAGFGGFGAHGFEGFINDFFRRKGQEQSQPMMPGTDIKVETAISLEDVLSGLTEEFSIKRHVVCQPCNGTGAKKEDGAVQKCNRCNGTGQTVTSLGRLHIASPCGQCGGSGKLIIKVCDSCSGACMIVQEEKIKITIPAGVHDGNVLRVIGKGSESPINNGPPGNLYVIIHVKPHSIFERDEDDIYHEQKIPFTTAVLGGKVTIPVLQGNADSVSMMEVVLNAGLSDEQYLQFENMGLPNMSTKNRGKQITKFLIEVPPLSNLSTKQKDLLRQLEESFK